MIQVMVKSPSLACLRLESTFDDFMIYEIVKKYNLQSYIT